MQDRQPQSAWGILSIIAPGGIPLYGTRSHSPHGHRDCHGAHAFPEPRLVGRRTSSAGAPSRLLSPTISTQSLRSSRIQRTSAHPREDRKEPASYAIRPSPSGTGLRNPSSGFLLDLVLGNGRHVNISPGQVLSAPRPVSIHSTVSRHLWGRRITPGPVCFGMGPFPRLGDQ